MLDRIKNCTIMPPYFILPKPMNNRTVSLFVLTALAVTSLMPAELTQASPSRVPPPAGYEDDVRVREPRINWFSDIDPNSRASGQNWVVK